MIQHEKFMKAAIEEARQGLAEGGIPIGSVLVKGDEMIGRGHNRRVQKKSAVLHAEMDCLENAGRLKAADYQKCVRLLDATWHWILSGMKAMQV
ncbi:MAG: nucleoside deaminase [Chlamydiae bacterium]|nr:nucleoside deaminase [Chlamydiota bacterium]MBI3265620.1 nucleoside deaminase [Chlamydiota bacterium]